MGQLRLGTERALCQADLLNTTSLSVIQAFILYIFTLRRYESARSIWCLVGLLIRLAVSIGLHRDGSSIPSMSPFEVEIRRRIWWHICCTEIRLNDGQVPEMGMSERDFETQEPTNVNDADIFPGMSMPPTPREGFTDTTITLIGCEKWRLTRAVQFGTSKLNSGQPESDASIEQKLEKLRHFKERLAAERYHWQLDQPIQLTLAILSKVHVNSWELMVSHHKCQPLSHGCSPDEKSFTLALAIVEDFFEFQSNEATKRWAWLVQGNIHWQPLAIVLARICSSSWDATAEHAWSLVMRSLRSVPAVAQTDPIWRALQHLVARAHGHRAQQLQQQARVLQHRHQETQPYLAYQSKDGLATDQNILGEPMISAAATPDSSQQDSQAFRGSPSIHLEASTTQADRIEEQIPWLFPGIVDDGQGTTAHGNIADLDNLVQSMDWEGWNTAFSS